MIFHLIRHGAKDAPADVLCGRMPGVRLSPLGRAQASWVAEQLVEAGITRIISSPRERAAETAAPLSERLGLAVETSAAIDEMAMGQWTGCSVARLAEAPEFRRFNRHRSLARIPEGETMMEVQARITSALVRWRDEPGAGAAAIFSHAEPIRAALIHFSGGTPDDWWRWEVEPGSITTLELGTDAARIVRLNHRAVA